MSRTNAHHYPKLRAVDARPILHEGRQFILLRDPLQLTDKTLVVPQPLAAALAFCDGSREDAGAVSAAMAIRLGVRIGADIIADLFSALDEVFLLVNERFLEAQDRTLEEYRLAPYRKPALAGSSYPADPVELRALLDGYLDGAGPDLLPANRLKTGRGLVSPHIDYTRGGPVYARVWKRAEEMVRAADVAVIFGTDHYGGDRQMTLTRQNYATPFGVLPTNRDVVDALAEAMGEDAAFAGELRHRGEHSIELASVWLHHTRAGKPCEVAPILCGSFHSFIAGEADAEQDATINAALQVLSERLAGRNAIVIAAGDLSHVGPAFGGPPVDIAGRAEIKKADDELIEHMCAGDAQAFLRAISGIGDSNNVCGVSPIYLALRLIAPAEGEHVAYDRCPADESASSLVSICGVVFN